MTLSFPRLVHHDASPVIALNQAVPVAAFDGLEVALKAVDRLEEKLAGCHACPATRSELLRRLGCSERSRAAYDRAVTPAGNIADMAYLTRRVL